MNQLLDSPDMAPEEEHTGGKDDIHVVDTPNQDGYSVLSEAETKSQYPAPAVEHPYPDTPEASKRYYPESPEPVDPNEPKAEFTTHYPATEEELAEPPVSDSGLPDEPRYPGDQYKYDSRFPKAS